MNNTNQTDKTVLTAVTQAIKAVKSGNRPLARLKLENAVTTEHENPNYWLWVAWTADSPSGTISALEQALRLAPDHPLAQLGMQWALQMQHYDVHDYAQQDPVIGAPDVEVSSPAEVPVPVAVEVPVSAESVELEPEHDTPTELPDVPSEAEDAKSPELVVDVSEVSLEPVEAAESDDFATPSAGAESDDFATPSAGAEDEVSFDTEVAEPLNLDDTPTNEAGDEVTKVELPATAEAEKDALESIDAIRELIDQDDAPEGEVEPQQANTQVADPQERNVSQDATQPKGQEAVVDEGNTSEAAVETDERIPILVVDDSPTIRKIVSMSFERIGYRVVTACDGMEALRRMTESRPALVLTDISMPQIDGYQLCKLIKSHEKTRDIPVIMLSGKDGMFDKIKGKFVGCDDYITKPFQSADLLEKVASYLPQPVSNS